MNAQTKRKGNRGRILTALRFGPGLLLILLLLLEACSSPEITAATTPATQMTPTIKTAATEKPTVTSDTPAARVEQLLAAMTLEEKVGQVLIIAFDRPYLDTTLQRMIQDYHIGGLIVYRHNIETLQGLAELSNEVQQTALDSGHVPLILCIDQEGGWVSNLYEEQGATELPSSMALAATGDVENARRMARVIAAEMRALGLNMNLAPVADVNVNPYNPIIGFRSFGDDPEQVATFVTAMVETYQAEGILATAKHFPGHGDTALDSHVALPSVPHDRDRLESVELVPFRAAIAADVAAIMTAHITFPAIDDTPGLPATLSSKVLAGLLHDEMGYDGLIVTDSLGMGAIEAAGRTIPQAAAEALAAGADVLLFAGGYGVHQAAHKRIVEAVRNGEIPQSRLDEAARRVLLAKARFGILDWQPVDVSAVTTNVGTVSHRAAARELAAQAVTLVRDEAGLLPLPEDTAVLVLETYGATGLGEVLKAAGRQVTVRGLRRPQVDPGTVPRIVTQAQEFDLTIVTTADLIRYEERPIVVEALLEADVPTVIVAVSSPYDLLAFPDAPTYVVTYGNNPPLLRAVADLLYGVTQPQGHLPVALPDLYERGHGLTGFVSQ